MNSKMLGAAELISNYLDNIRILKFVSFNRTLKVKDNWSLRISRVVLLPGSFHDNENNEGTTKSSFNATKCLRVVLFCSSLSFAEYMRICHFLCVSENCREIYT